MKDSIVTEADCKKMASLAKIYLSDSEVEKFTNNLQSLLELMVEFSKADVSGFENIHSLFDDDQIFASDMVETFRDDLENNQYTANEITENAKVKVLDYFAVKKVIGE